MDLEQFIGIAIGLGALVGMIWQISQLKHRLEDDFDDKLEKLKDIVIQQDKAITALEHTQRTDNQATNERVTNLHEKVRSKVSDLIHATNEMQNWLQKASKDDGCRFVVRQREKETLSHADDEDSWTSFG